MMLTHATRTEKQLVYQVGEIFFHVLYFLLLASGFLPRPFLIIVFRLHIPLYIGDSTLVHSGSWEALFYP